MLPRSLWASGSICLRCQWRIASLNNRTARLHTSRKVTLLATQVPSTHSRRAFYATAAQSQTNSTPASIEQSIGPDFDPTLVPRAPRVPIRQHLEKWQEQYGVPSDDTLAAFERHPARSDISNVVSKLSNGLKAGEDAPPSQWAVAEEDEGAEMITIGLFLKPGDVVELSQSGREPVLAVFVQQIDNTSQFFSIDGKWVHSRLARVAFAIPGYIKPSLVQALLPFLPTDPDKANPKGEIHVPSGMATPILEVLGDVTEKAERVYRANAAILDTAYAKLADPTRIRMMTLAQIARTLLGHDDPEWTPSPPDLLAVRKALLHNEFRFTSDKRNHRLTNVFAIRPKNDVEIVEMVHGWVREYRESLAASVNPTENGSQTPTGGAAFITSFIEKAQRMIIKSRMDREPNPGNVGPSKHRYSLTEHSSTTRTIFGVSLNDNDAKIIQFLKAWVLTGQFENMAGLHAACTSIIMETGQYKPGMIRHTPNLATHVDAIQRSTGALFLQEIGAILPHENLALYNEQLMLPTIQASRNLAILHTRAEDVKKNPDFEDSMAGMRQDWGATTVYCIDDAGAHEIDDGISLERVKNTNSEFWIHVHVANPTAFFDKTHTLTGLAAHMGESIYTPERVYPMLPLWAVEDFFSMERNRPVITFSSRVDSTGNVLEKKIQHGIVHNVVSITPSELAAVLGDEIATEKRSFVVGGQSSPKVNNRTPPQLNAEQILELQNMYNVARTLWGKRKAAGSFRISFGSPTVRVFEKDEASGLRWYPSLPKNARHVRGDPIIEVTNTIPPRTISFDVNATNIVEEMMILAGQTAASWCAERNIPVMYRGTIDIPNSNGISKEDFKKNVVEPYLEKHGDLTPVLASKYMQSLGRGVAHFSPIPHNAIGISSYAKVTSPLRRFSDMMTHWQIEGAIRYEARTGKKLDAARLNPSESGLPFSQRQMQESIVTLQPKEVLIRATKRSSAAYWTALAFMRAFHYKEAELPSTFKCWINYVPEQSGNLQCIASGNIPEYGISVTMANKGDARMGDEWEVAIDTVDLFTQRIYVKPLRLLYREPELL